MATHRKARPTSYNGVMLRSRSEACYAKWLVSVLKPEIDIEYEPSQYAVGDYTPDFSVEYDGGVTVIEYKPADVSDSYLLYAKNHAEALFQQSGDKAPCRFLIHCGSFYEDIPVIQYEFIPDYDYQFIETKGSYSEVVIAIKCNPFRVVGTWLSRFVSFSRRQEIASTRWDLR